MMPSILITKKSLLLYYKDYPKLLIPWIGLNFSISLTSVYEIVNIKYKDKIPTQLEAKYIGDIPEFKDKKITIVPMKDNEGYVCVENNDFNDYVANKRLWIKWCLYNYIDDVD